VPTAVRRLVPVDRVPLGAQSRHGLIQARGNARDQGLNPDWVSG